MTLKAVEYLFSAKTITSKTERLPQVYIASFKTENDANTHALIM